MSRDTTVPEAVFEALADPTRRDVLDRVVERGSVTATELAEDLPVTRQAIAKHLAVLRAAGLVTSRRSGRETRFTGDPAPLNAATRWLAETGAAWEERLTRLQRRAAAIEAERPATGDAPR
jgi:DNA-binding transcriptional ArsR family regulator